MLDSSLLLLLMFVGCVVGSLVGETVALVVGLVGWIVGSFMVGGLVGALVGLLIGNVGTVEVCGCFVGCFVGVLEGILVGERLAMLGDVVIAEGVGGNRTVMSSWVGVRGEGLIEGEVGEDEGCAVVGDSV